MCSNVCIDDYFCDGLLGKILRRCPPESYELLRSVSKRWDQVVDRYLGRVLIVKSGNTYVVDPESNLDRMSIRANYWMTLSSSCGVDENASGDGDGNGDSDAAVEEVVEKLQDVSNPESVRKIGFVGQLGQLSGYKPLECILNPCKNITSLYLHLSIFSATKEMLKMEKKPEPWQVSCIIPRLKELVIDSCGISCEDSTDLLEYRPTLLSTAAFLCSQKFIALEKLIFRVPYMESVEGIIVRSICIFMGRHATTLKHFAFTQKYELDDSSSDENQDEENQGEKGEHRGEGDSFVEKGRDGYFSTNVNYLSLTQLGLSAQELKNVCLEEFHVALACKQESAPVWKNMLIKQNHLRKCIFAGDKLPIPSGTIEGNCSTLVTVRLDVRDGVNLACFRNCVNLKHLSLGGRNEVDESFNDGEGNSEHSGGSEKYYPLTAYLKNAKFLPVGLESLEIINLKTHKEDASIIALHLRNLRDLILKNIGWEGNLGLRLCDLMKVWRVGRLDHLCVKQSLNLMSYSELEENSSSPEVNLFACVIQSNSFTTASKFFLEVWRREDGGSGSGGLYTTRKPDSVEQSDEEELDVFQMPNKVELCEEEEEEDESSSDSEEEREEDDDDGDAEEGGGDKQGDSDEEWQECEDEEEETDDD